MSNNTLTDMLINCDTHFEQDQLIAAKEVFKEWLRTIDIPDYGTPEVARKMFIILIDEP